MSCAWSRESISAETGVNQRPAPPTPKVTIGKTIIGNFFLVIVASIDLLSVVPANVYGYAVLVAYSLHQPSAAPATGPLQNLVSSPSFANPLVLLIVSMVIGALFGYASD